MNVIDSKILSKRTKNALIKDGYKTFYDVLDTISYFGDVDKKYPRDDGRVKVLLRIPSIGIKAHDEIMQEVSAL